MQPDTTICEIAVSLQPYGDVRAGAEDAHLHAAIDRASESARRAVEREVSRSLRATGSHSAVGRRAGSGAVEIMLEDDRMSQLKREILERPENDLRSIRVREYWRPVDVQDDESTEDYKV